MNPGNSGIIGAMKDSGAAVLSTPRAMAERHRRTLDVETVRIPIHSHKYPGLYALVDEQDAELVNQYRWNVFVRREMVRKVHAHISHKRLWIPMHRLILGVEPGIIVDHINRNPLDNRRANLRIATFRGNAINCKPYRVGTSVYRGVVATDGRWRVNIRTPEGKQVYPGWCNDEQDAALLYDVAARHFHGEYAVLNFPNSKPSASVLAKWDRWRAEHPRAAALLDQGEDG